MTQVAFLFLHVLFEWMSLNKITEVIVRRNRMSWMNSSKECEWQGSSYIDAKMHVWDSMV